MCTIWDADISMVVPSSIKYYGMAIILWKNYGYILVWISWINGLQHVDVMVKFVEFPFFMLMPMLPVDSQFKPKGIRSVVSLRFSYFVFTISVALITFTHTNTII